MDGYMIDVEYDEQTLRVRGKNKAARIALAGEAYGDGDVVIPRSTITGATFKVASMFVNGNLVVTTTDRHEYQLHFRKKQQSDFERLAQELDGALAQRFHDAVTAPPIVPSTAPRPSLADRISRRQATSRQQASSRKQASVWDLPGQVGAFDQDVVGESFHTAQLALLFKAVHVDSDGVNLHAKASLVPEPLNEYDPLAVAVVVRGQTVGHLPSNDAARFQPTLLAATKAGRDPQVDARLRARSDELEPSKVWYSVRLDLAPPEVITAK
jgi:hypothetical protein